jgi:hypothetical protein
MSSPFEDESLAERKPIVSSKAVTFQLICILCEAIMAIIVLLS